MKKRHIGLVILSLILVCAMAVNLTGCTMTAKAEDLMKGIKPNNVNVIDDLNLHNADVTDFAIRLFKASEQGGGNTLVSPLSVLRALAMTVNGAENETLQQMEKVLGMKTEDLNMYLYSYMKNLPQGDKYKLKLANSVWFTQAERFTVDKNFLQTNADYYGADIYKAPFDNRTCTDINNWVKEKTDEMIPEILNEISPTAVMILVNALAFEAEWSEIYEYHQVEDGKFTKEDGTKQEAQFMNSTEDVYLEDDNATGFIKYYKDGKYAFAAMLPKKDVSVSDYVASLDGKALNALLANPQYATVYTSIPKFEAEYTVEMAEILKTMGMPLAFDYNNAEFSSLGTSSNGNIFIEKVYHKTYISVGEKGTKAGAATAVIMENFFAEPQEPKEVYLDRPFVYMLIDCENNIPFFIGTMMNVEK